jgi:hypothetical protein
MKLLKLDTDSLKSLGGVEEASMDFWIVLAEQNEWKHLMDARSE